MSQKRLLYLLALACILAALFGGGIVKRLAGSGSGSNVLADSFWLICVGAALFFILRANRVPRNDAEGVVQPPSKHQALYVIVGAILAVALVVAVLFLTGSH
jgi:hypothetical protein